MLFEVAKMRPPLAGGTPSGFWVKLPSGFEKRRFRWCARLPDPMAMQTPVCNLLSDCAEADRKSMMMRIMLMKMVKMMMMKRITVTIIKKKKITKKMQSNYGESLSMEQVAQSSFASSSLV